MVVVKRYPNRKLYDTAAKRYVSLDILADLVRRGQDVQVLDHATGDDVTVPVLAQIIAAQERKQGGFLPLPLLTGWIQAGGETLASLRRAMAAQLAAQLAAQSDILRQADEEIERRLARLVGSGELTENEGQRLRELLLAGHQETIEAIHPPEQMMASFRDRYGIPSRADIRKLSDQIDALTQEVETLSPQQPPTEP